MVVALDLELNSQPMQRGLSDIDALMGRVVNTAGRMGSAFDGSSRAFSSFTVNSLQAVNNVANLTRGLTAISNGSTTLAAGIGAAGVELGLLAGNFIHLYQASQLAGGPRGFAGLWAALKANPLVLVTAGIIALAQGIALFATSAKDAQLHAQSLNDTLKSLGSTGAVTGAGGPITERLSSQVNQLRGSVDRTAAASLEEQFQRQGYIDLETAKRRFPSLRLDEAHGYGGDRPYILTKSDLDEQSRTQLPEREQELAQAQAAEARRRTRDQFHAHERSTLGDYDAGNRLAQLGGVDREQEAAILGYRRAGVGTNADTEAYIRASVGFQDATTKAREFGEAVGSALGNFDPTKPREYFASLVQGIAQATQQLLVIKPLMNALGGLFGGLTGAPPTRESAAARTIGASSSGGGDG